MEIIKAKYGTPTKESMSTEIEKADFVLCLDNNEFTTLKNGVAAGLVPQKCSIKSLMDLVMIYRTLDTIKEELPF